MSREVELKAVLDDWDARRERLLRAGAAHVGAGRLEDRRYDTPDRRLAARDEVLRLRVYHVGAQSRGQLDWKGPTSLDGGYKVREELASGVTDPGTVGKVLECLGYLVTLRIDRQIEQFELGGAVVRFERYPRMDDLVEVEGAPAAIEDAIGHLGLPRSAFTSERLRAFAARFEARTGVPAALSDEELLGRLRHRPEDA